MFVLTVLAALQMQMRLVALAWTNAMVRLASTIELSHLHMVAFPSTNALDALAVRMPGRIRKSDFAEFNVVNK
jgi:hypothetical protein